MFNAAGAMQHGVGTVGADQFLAVDSRAGRTKKAQAAGDTQE